jgi:hypothetical protein
MPVKQVGIAATILWMTFSVRDSFELFAPDVLSFVNIF